MRKPKSASPANAPKVAAPSRKHPNYFREADTKLRLRSPMSPMKSKRLSK